MRKVLFIILCVIFATPGYAASLINDTETERVITDLIAPLASAADIPDGRLRVHIVGDNQFNAFVMGGEDVYVYTGLLTQIKSPDALQAVRCRARIGAHDWRPHDANVRPNEC